MNLKNPRVTITNTDGESWQLTADGLLSGLDGLESVTFTVLVPQSQKSVTDLTNDAIQRAIELHKNRLSVTR